MIVLGSLKMSRNSTRLDESHSTQVNNIGILSFSCHTLSSCLQSCEIWKTLSHSQFNLKIGALSEGYEVGSDISKLYQKKNDFLSGTNNICIIC